MGKKDTMARGKAQGESFEELFRRLEETVTKLEAGGLTLNQSLALYEEGMALARSCQEMLDTAELKITRLKETFAPYSVPSVDEGEEAEEGT